MSDFLPDLIISMINVSDALIKIFYYLMYFAKAIFDAIINRISKKFS